MTSVSGNISQRAQHGFAKAAAYDQHRPSYPEHSVQFLLEQVRLDGAKGRTVLDLAAGTGKFTELLAARPEQFEIIAIEPHDGMREVLQQKKLSNVTVKSGRADATGLEDESVDAVIVAQAFHWFAKEDTLKELHRILKPHGALGLIWNIEDYNAPRSDKASTAWEEKLHDIMWSLDDNEPRFRHEKWRAVFDEQIKSTPLTIIAAADPLFALPLGENKETWEVKLSKHKVWDRFSTLSQIALLGEDDLKQTHSTVLEALNAPDVETDANGDVTLHGSTYTAWSTNIPSEGRSTLTGVQRKNPGLEPEE